MDSWNSLEKLHKSKAVASQYTRRDKLFRLGKRIDQYGSSFVEDISEIENYLHKSDYKLGNDDGKFTLSQDLGTDYDMMRTVLQNTPTITF